MHPADIAHIAEQMSPAEAADVFEVLDDETAAKAMAELPEEHQAAVLTAMDPAEAADVLDEMEPDEAADVLGDVSEERAAELMSLMDPQAALEVQTLLQYPENTAGGLMTTSFVTVVEGDLVASGLRAVSTAVANGDEVDQIYVTDAEGRLRGSIPLAQLIAAPAQMAVEMVMARDVRTVPLEEPDEEVARLLVHYGLLSVPVIEDSRKLMGVVGIADVIDLFAPRTWRSRPRSVRA
jgi:Mg/Co/Ni transporter MgtE